MPLTEIKIQSLRPQQTTKKYSDGEGLYLEVPPSGSKWWRLKYRFQRKEKRISLGVYPQVTLRQARVARSEARALLARGVDPSEARKSKLEVHAHGSASCFETVAKDWFSKQAPGWAESHSSRVKRLLERDLFPWLRTRSVTDIKPPELLTVLRRIESRGAVETAHRALRNCGMIFKFAMATGVTTQDPTIALRGALTPLPNEKNFAAVTDPKRIGELLEIIDGYRGTLPVRCALRLAPLLFVRPGELRNAEWKDIDLDAGEWRYVVTKTDKNHIVPLSRQAVALFRELQPLTGNGRFVFPNARSQSKPMSDNALLAALRTLGISKSELVTHGWRATARTILDEELEFRPDFIEHQLAHEVLDPNGRAYNRTAFLTKRREMMQIWADYLDGLKSCGPA